MKKTLQISNGIALVSVIIINWLAATGAMNGVTVGEMSARYQTLFTPAGYAFGIWSLIYIALFAFTVYQGLSLFKKDADDDLVMQIGWYFVYTCIANALWVINWVYNYTFVSVLIMILLLYSLIQIIYRTNMEMDIIPIKKIALVWWPFCLYAGWITVALIANIAAWLTKIGWSGWGLSEVTWTIIMIIAAGVINIATTWTRNMREFSLVGVWALIAIAVANWGDVPSVVYSTIIVAVAILISATIHAIKNRDSSCLERAEGKPIIG